jgi:hypothetical protein
MKMSRYQLFFLITGLLVLLMPLRAGAAGMDIGMSTWYCWWQPSWNNENEGFKVDPAFYFGPGVSFRLPGKVTMSTSFLYARVKAESTRRETSIPWSPAMEKRVIHRYDSDTAISYSFTRFFKLFAGFKYSHYKYENDQTLLFPLLLSMYFGTKEKYRYDNYAPALGIGFTVHLIENFFLLIKASVLYEKSSIVRNAYWYASGTPPMFFPFPPEHWSVNKVGANAHLSFAYFIQPINTSISIGFRYQFFKIVKSDSKNEDYTEYYDHFYGITASVVYRIDFEKKEKQEYE